MEETHPLILQQLNSLQIYCTKKENGCEWKGPRSNLQDHFQLSCSSLECENKSKGCKWKGQMKKRELHLVKECEFVKVFCKHRKTVQCEFSTERKLISSHEFNCQKYLDNQKQIEKKMEDEKRKQQELKERKKMEEIQKKLQERKEEVLSNRAIRINVSGTLFTTSLKTLCADQSSLLYSIYIDYLNNTNKNTTKSHLHNGNKNITINTSNIVNNNKSNNNDYGSKGGRREEEGEEEIFLDCDTKSFSHILFWLRSGELPMDLKEKEIQCIRITSSYLNLTSLLSYLPSYFPSLPSSQSQKFMEISSKLSKNQNTSSSLSFSPSLVIPDQFYNLLSNDKENQLENNSQNNPNKKRKFEELGAAMRDHLTNNINKGNLKNINRRKLTSDQVVSVSQKKKCKVDMRRRDLSKERAVGLQLTNALFNESLFKESSLTYCNFTSSDFNKSNFENAILKQSNFKNANLSDCNFQNANLSNANLSSADLSNSNLSHANLSNANLSNSDLSFSNLSNTDLSYADLSNSELSNVNLSNTNLSSSNLTNANLSNSDFSNSNLVSANLSSANLSNANLSNSNLFKCKLSNCNLSGTNFDGASLIGSFLHNSKSAVFNKINFMKNYFSKCDLTSTKFISCDLTSCNFSESNLTSTDFAGSNITNVNFSKAIITNADFSNTTGCPLSTSIDSHPYGVPQKIQKCHCGSPGNVIMIQNNSGSAAFQCICNNCFSKWSNYY